MSALQLCEGGSKATWQRPEGKLKPEAAVARNGRRPQLEGTGREQGIYAVKRAVPRSSARGRPSAQRPSPALRGRGRKRKSGLQPRGPGTASTADAQLPARGMGLLLHSRHAPAAALLWSCLLGLVRAALPSPLLFPPLPPFPFSSLLPCPSPPPAPPPPLLPALLLCSPAGSSILTWLCLEHREIPTPGVTRRGGGLLSPWS